MLTKLSSSSLAVATFAAIFVSLTGCGKEELPDAPVFKLDRETVTFGQEFGNATLVGQKPQESLLIENGGLQPLKLDPAVFVGDDVFTVEGPAVLNVEGKQHTFVRVVFSPREAKQYQGILTLTSNDPTAKEKKVTVSGKGQLGNPDGG